MTMVSCNGMIFFIPALTPRVLVTVSGRSGLHVLSGEVSLEKWIVVCPNCHASGDPYRFTNRSGILRCRHCQHNTYLTAGTVMKRSHTPLMVWFWVAYLITSQTLGMSALQFQTTWTFSLRDPPSRYSTSSMLAWCARIRIGLTGHTSIACRSRRDLIPIIDRPGNISNT